MKVIVCVKHVPDSQANRHFTAEGTVERAEVDGLLCELDEHAVEQALRLVDDGLATEVVVLTMGPGAAEDAIRKALQMGADRGIHVMDDALPGSDVFATATVLAAAARREGFDLLLTGMASTDAWMSVVPALLAEYLDITQLTFASEVALQNGTVTIRRETEVSVDVVSGSLPAVLSVTDRIGEARYPSFKGIMAAKKKTVERVSLEDLGVDAQQVGSPVARTRVEEVVPRPPKGPGLRVNDDGQGGRELAAFLTARAGV